MVQYSISTVLYYDYRYLNKKLKLDKIYFILFENLQLDKIYFILFKKIFFICKTGLNKNSIKGSTIENSTCENMI